MKGDAMSREISTKRPKLTEAQLAQLGALYKNFPSDTRVGLRVYVATPEYILAMKLQALRVNTRDFDDVIFLTKELNLTNVQSLLELYAKQGPRL